MTQLFNCVRHYWTDQQQQNEPAGTYSIGDTKSKKDCEHEYLIRTMMASVNL